MATKPERKTVKLQMFLHRKPDGTETLNQYDHTQGNTNQYWVGEMGACLGEVEVNGTYVTIEADAREILIGGLEKAIEKERGESQARVNLLMERISQLKCITHESAS